MSMIFRGEIMIHKGNNPAEIPQGVYSVEAMDKLMEHQFGHIDVNYKDLDRLIEKALDDLCEFSDCDDCMRACEYRDYKNGNRRFD